VLQGKVGVISDYNIDWQVSVSLTMTTYPDSGRG